MKKLIDLAFLYAAVAMGCGVFYREFTKYYAFEGRTVLGVAHVHLLVLGTILFLLLATFALRTDLMEQVHFRRFLILYQVALPAMVVMLMVRGVFQVMGSPMSRALDASISGIAGITHILMAVSFILLYFAMRNLKEK